MILKNFLSRAIQIDYEDPLKTWKHYSKKFPGPFRSTEVSFYYDSWKAPILDIESHDIIWKVKDEDVIEHELDPVCNISLFRIIHIKSHWYYLNDTTWEKMEEKELNLP